MIKNKTTLILISILAILLIVLVCLGIAVVKNVLSPSAEYIELPISENITLSQAKELLDSLGISYETKATESKTANRVERFEYVGKEEDGKKLVEIGSVVTLYSNEKPMDKVIYLTFDDGPKVNYTYSMEIYHTTGKLLDVLDKYGIKATFFLVGYQMIKTDRSEYVIDTLNRGHLIACHTSTHDFGSIYNSTSKFVSDVERFEGELKNIIGEERYDSLEKFIRFPGGSSTNGKLSKIEAKEYISAIRNMGYKVYDWTALTGDAEGKSTANEFISYMDSGLEKAKENGDPLIVLMHDTDDTTQALDKIISHLIEKGYYFDTIDSCHEYTFAEN